GQTRAAAGGVPLALELALDLVVALARIGVAGVVAEAIGRGVVVVAVVRQVVGLAGVLVAPVGVLGGRVDALGDTLAGQATDDGADGRTDHRADRTGHRADRGTGDRATGRGA